MSTPLTGVYLRLGAALLALAAGAAAVVAMVLLLHRTPGPTSSAAPGPVAAPATVASKAAAVRDAAPRFPAPPHDAVVFGRQDGGDAVALAVVPGRGRLRLQASVVGPQGSGVRGLAVSFDVAGTRSTTEASATPCGPGCYGAGIALRGRPTRVLVRLGAGRALAFAMPTAWPPPAADRLVARAARVWRNLRTLVSHERLASDETHGVTTRWEFAAPDRFAYRIVDGSSAVVVGRSRWDRQPGGRWLRSQQEPPLRQPVPFWAAVTDAHVLGTIRIQGRPAWLVSFFDPTSTAWFTVGIDRGTLRTLDLRMTATAHFMHDAYGPFNAPLRIVPPVYPGGKR